MNQGPRPSRMCSLTAVAAATLLASACRPATIRIAAPTPPAPSGHCPSDVARTVTLTDNPPPYPSITVPVGTIFQAEAPFGGYPATASKAVAPICVQARGDAKVTFFRAVSAGSVGIESRTAGCGQCNQTVLHAVVVIDRS